MSDADIRQMVREFRESVTGDLADQHRRMDEFTAEIRARIDSLDRQIRLTETTMINELRALADRFDRRLARIETRLNELGT